jgi:hypothetical protein
VELEHIAVVLLQIGAEGRMLYKQPFVLGQPGEKLADFGIGVEEAVQGLDPGASDLDFA